MFFIKNYIKSHPMQSFLFAYNTSVFAYLKVIGRQIVNAVPTQFQNILATLPASLTSLPVIGTYLTPEYLSNFFQNSPYSWIVGSLIISVLLSFVGHIIRFFVSIAIMLIGAYLVYVFAKAHGIL